MYSLMTAKDSNVLNCKITKKFNKTLNFEYEELLYEKKTHYCKFCKKNIRLDTYFTKSCHINSYKHFRALEAYAHQ